MLLGIVVGHVYHLLEATPGGTQEKQIICVTMYASIIWSNLASSSRPPEIMEQVVHVEAKDDGGEYRALSDSILYGEVLGGIIVPSDIT